MKKITKIALILIVAIMFGLSLQSSVNAASLDSIDITISSEKIMPGEEVTVDVKFGKPLGSYTFDFAYDNQLLEFVRAEGGTTNDNGTRIRVYYFDTAGGTNPRESMSITFKAKTDLITTNPTDISITAEGLANNDASEEYDDITTPIVKNLTIEPDYQDYEINLNYDGQMVEEEEKQVKLSIQSALGKSYDHARLIAKVQTTTGGTVTLKGTDEQMVEHEIIQSGWGDASGYKIGGKDVNQTLQLTALFTKAGKYTITFELIDRDNADSIIASKEVTVDVQPKGSTPSTPDQEEPEVTPPTEEETPTTPETSEPEKEETPTTLPKTGTENIYTIVSLLIMLLSTIYIMQNKKDKKA